MIILGLCNVYIPGKRDVCYDVVNQILSTVFIDTASECLLKRLENKGISQNLNQHLLVTLF